MSEERRKPENPPSQDDRVASGTEEEFRRTQKMLQVLFRDAYYKYHADELIPDSPPDFSFMEDSPFEKEEAEKTKVSRRRQPGRALWIAATLIVCFLLGGGMFCLTDTSFAHAARFHLEKIMYQISGCYYSSDDGAEAQEDSISIRVDSMDEIDQAVRFMPELYVPSVISEGWELDRLELKKTIKGLKTAKYTFVDQASGKFSIDEEFLPDIVEAYNYIEGDMIELDNRKVLLLKDNHTGLIGINFIENNVFVTISGELQETELLCVADNLTQPGVSAKKG